MCEESPLYRFSIRSRDIGLGATCGGEHCFDLVEEECAKKVHCTAFRSVVGISLDLGLVRLVEESIVSIWSKKNVRRKSIVPLFDPY
jgi:hypothetical protein